MGQNRLGGTRFSPRLATQSFLSVDTLPERFRCVRRCLLKPSEQEYPTEAGRWRLRGQWAGASTPLNEEGGRRFGAARPMYYAQVRAGRPQKILSKTGRSRAQVNGSSFSCEAGSMPGEAASVEVAAVPRSCPRCEPRTSTRPTTASRDSTRVDLDLQSQPSIPRLKYAAWTSTVRGRGSRAKPDGQQEPRRTLAVKPPDRLPSP